MPNRQDTSIFSVIGPIMVGPSSSHTAGAIRLGQLGRGLLGGQPTQATIELHGSFAETGVGHGTDKAIIAGLLAMATDDLNIRTSHQLAAEQGLTFTFESVNLGEDAHPNSVRMTLTAGQQRVTFVGASVGGGAIEITEVQGYPVQFSGSYDTVLIQAADRPGTINAITGWLLEREINVAFLRVERDQRGGRAMMIIEVDQPLNTSEMGQIAEFEWVYWVRSLPRLKE